MRRPAIAAVALLALAPQHALGATARSGEAFVPPPLPSARELARLDAHPYTLLELDRTHGRRAVPAVRAAGGKLVSTTLGIWRVPTPAAQRLIPQLRVAGLLRAVEPDRHRATFSHLSAGDPLLGDQWWVAAVRARDVEPPGPGRPVTVIDSGLDRSHPEFERRRWTVMLNAQHVPEEKGEEHGTAVSSVVAAPANGLGLVGVYPNALLMEWDFRNSVSSSIRGIQAASRWRGVINLSYGGDDPSFMEEEAILAAFGRGSVVVAAAGNEFGAGNKPQYPASYNHVLTVAATNAADEPASFSSATLAVDIAAPGVNIPVAVPTWANPTGYAVYDGTSFAAPLVSGATGLVWTRRRTLDNTQIFDLMRRSARDVGSNGFDTDTGYGVLHIGEALASRAPRTDPLEPNEDVDHVKANGLFRRGRAPITRPGRLRATITARVDASEDPEDVFRVWVPARGRVDVHVEGTDNVDVELWGASTPSVHVEGAARERHLIDGSYKPGAAEDVVVARNPARRGTFVYLDVYVPKDGPSGAVYTARIVGTA